MYATIVRSPVLFFILFLLANLLQCSNSQALDLQAKSTVFCRPGGNTYVEVSLSVNSRSVHFQKQPTGLLQAAVRVEWFFYQADSVVKTDRYRLSSQPIDSGEFRNFPSLIYSGTRFQLGFTGFNCVLWIGTTRLITPLLK